MGLVIGAIILEMTTGAPRLPRARPAGVSPAKAMVPAGSPIWCWGRSSTASRRFVGRGLSDWCPRLTFPFPVRWIAGMLGPSRGGP